MAELRFLGNKQVRRRRRSRSSGAGLSTPVGGGAGTLVINDVTVTEGIDSTATFTVTRSGGSTGAISVDYTTTAGTALAGADYTTTAGTLNFADGDLTKTITVPILNSTNSEPTETFTVTLSNPVGTTITDATGTCTIYDADIAMQAMVFSLPYPVYVNF